MIPNIPGFFRQAVVGSRYTGGDHSASDLDLLILVRSMGPAISVLSAEGFSHDGHEDYAGEAFGAYRRGDLNILLTDDPEFFDRFLDAAELCRLLGVTDRTRRVIVHNVVRDGLHAEFDYARSDRLLEAFTSQKGIAV